MGRSSDIPWVAESGRYPSTTKNARLIDLQGSLELVKTSLAHPPQQQPDISNSESALPLDYCLGQDLEKLIIQGSLLKLSCSVKDNPELACYTMVGYVPLPTL